MSSCMVCGHRDYGPCLAVCGQPDPPFGARPGVQGPFQGPFVGQPLAPGSGIAAPPLTPPPLIEGDPWPARARGTLIVDVTELLSVDGSGRGADVVLETYLEQLRSRWLAGRVLERLQAEGAPLPSERAGVESRLASSVRASRRGQSAVLEVSVANAISSEPSYQSLEVVDLCRAILDEFVAVAGEQQKQAPKVHGARAKPVIPVRVLDACEVTDTRFPTLERL